MGAADNCNCPLTVFPISCHTLSGAPHLLRTERNRMAMNIKKVVIGGLVAGVVLNVVDFISNYALAARMNAEADAFKPGLSAQMSTSSSMVSYIIMDFAMGIALVWTYAAIRPRFGPGPRTAMF